MSDLATEPRRSLLRRLGDLFTDEPTDQAELQDMLRLDEAERVEQGGVLEPSFEPETGEVTGFGSPESVVIVQSPNNPSGTSSAAIGIEPPHAMKRKSGRIRNRKGVIVLSVMGLCQEGKRKSFRKSGSQ